MKHKHCMTWNIQEILKNVEKEKCSLWDLEYDEKTETHGNEKWALLDLGYGKKYWKCEKWKMHTVGPRICRENRKTRKMISPHCRIKEYGKKKKWKRWKMTNAHNKTWNMARNTEKIIMHTLGPRKLKKKNV